MATTSPARSATTSPVRSAAAVVARSDAAVEMPDASVGVAAPMDTKPVQDTSPIITRAAAFRVKYRKHASVRLGISQVGFHPANRDGQPPSSARCVSLLQEILDIGFDVDEANAGGVVVESVTNQAKLVDFNIEACEGDERLAPVDRGSMRYGALAHNHLNQILKNIAAAAAADIPQVCDGQGKLSLAKLRSTQPAFAHAVDNGLTWEVLSGAIETEEPHALDVIQSALNAKNGLFLLAHEMQAISKLSAVTSALTGVGQQISWRMAREKMKDTMPQFTEDEHFLELFRFVVDLGANTGPFITDLRSFHDKFVDPKLRKIRSSTFILFNMIPEQFSFMKVAAVKHVYSCDVARVQHGYCDPFRKQVMKQLLDERALRDVMQEGEQLLSFFHTACAEVLAALVKAEKTRFLGNLDREVFSAIIGAYGGRPGDVSAEMRQADLHTIAEKFYARLAPSAKGSPHAKVPSRCWQVAVAGPTLPTKGTKLQSKVLTFDEHGKPLSRQDTSEGPELEQFEWLKFFNTESVGAAARQDRTRALVFSVLCRMQRSAHAASASAEVDITRGGSSMHPRVVAAKDFAARALRLLPLVKTIAAISFKEGLPWELAVQVMEGGASSTTVYLQGSSILPKSPAAPAAAEPLPGSRRSDHAWKASDFPWPLWLVKRSTTVDECNCQFEMCATRHVSTYQTSAHAATDQSSCTVDTAEVTIPVLTNTKDISAGEELVVHWKKKEKSSSTPKTKTWQDEAAQEYRQAKKASRS